ncbi:neural cell adhesion molecule 2-like [Cimex lectularius]|uniref:Uncharacterized protein n=1 Tax=Cimex lectularius TaxID=79782 RepID=A0A8I6SK45_CIMLE|nr:neural cell adhesion molecule 2-like [Cimex lectularius]
MAWFGPNGVMIDAKKGRIHVEERYEGKGFQLLLLFEYIMRNDKGNYTCKSFSSDSANSSESFTLLVIKPIEFQGNVSQQIALEGKSTIVRCEVTGDPQPYIQWYFNNEKVNVSDGEKMRVMPSGLHMSKVTLENEGEYECRAFQYTQKSSNMLKKKINLIVKHMPKWPSEKKSKSSKAKNVTEVEEEKIKTEIVFGYFGGVANITCYAIANPFADYFWTRNNKTLNPNWTSVITHTKYSVLQVRMLDSSVLGDYECFAKNEFGSAWKIFHLKQGFKPSEPRHVTVAAVGATSAHFRLHAYGKDHVIGYRIQFIKRSLRSNIEEGDYQDVFTRNGTPYAIVNLQENTEYVYRVAARNAAGLSDYSPIQSFRTRERSVASGSCEKSSLFFQVAAIALGLITTRML